MKSKEMKFEFSATPDSGVNPSAIIQEQKHRLNWSYHIYYTEKRSSLTHLTHFQLAWPAPHFLYKDLFWWSFNKLILNTSVKKQNLTIGYIQYIGYNVNLQSFNLTRNKGHW